MQEDFRLRPEIVDATMGELAYQDGMGNSDRDDRTSCRIWSRAGEPAAYAVFWPPCSLDCWQVHPKHPDLIEDVLDWFESVADVSENSLRLQVRDGDTDAEKRIRAHGYTEGKEGPLMILNVRDLDEIDEPQLPSASTASASRICPPACPDPPVREAHSAELALCACECRSRRLRRTEEHTDADERAVSPGGAAPARDAVVGCVAFEAC